MASSRDPFIASDNPREDNSRLRVDPAHEAVLRTEEAAQVSEDLARDIAARMAISVEGLLRAHEYAQDVECEAWDFALEIAELRSAGLTTSDLRWLVHKRYVEHGREVTEPGDERRAFRRVRGMTFTRRSCFVLTPRGATLFRQLRQRLRETASVSRTSVDSPRRVEAPAAIDPGHLAMPVWDRDRQELRIGGMVVKQFKVPAPNQEMILAAFEEEGWPPRIDDPLPPQPHQDPKRRLHDTINSLNRNHRAETIRFTGDGSGQGVRWEFVARGER